MTAGRGIAHSEESVGDQGVVHAAQLWIALPDAQPLRTRRSCTMRRSGGAGRWLSGHRAGPDRRSISAPPVMLFSELIGVDFVADRAAHTRIELQRHHEHAVLCLRWRRAHRWSGDWARCLALRAAGPRPRRTRDAMAPCSCC